MTGKQRYTYRTVRGGKREAQRVLAEMVTEAGRGLAPKSGSTVGELLEAWFELATADFSPTTVRETRGFIDRSLLPAFGEKRLAKPPSRRGDVEEVLGEELLGVGPGALGVGESLPQQMLPTPIS